MPCRGIKCITRTRVYLTCTTVYRPCIRWLLWVRKPSVADAKFQFNEENNDYYWMNLLLHYNINRWRLCTNIYIVNMQSILIEHVVKLKIWLTRPVSSVDDTWSKSNQRAAIQSDYWMRTPSLTDQSEHFSALASACGTRCVLPHKPIIIMLLSVAAECCLQCVPP